VAFTSPDDAPPGMGILNGRSEGLIESPSPLRTILMWIMLLPSCTIPRHDGRSTCYEYETNIFLTIRLIRKPQDPVKVLYARIWRYRTPARWAPMLICAMSLPRSRWRGTREGVCAKGPALYGGACHVVSLCFLICLCCVGLLLLLRKPCCSVCQLFLALFCVLGFLAFGRFFVGRGRSETSKKRR
jgi:hypothetical protein